SSAALPPAPACAPRSSTSAAWQKTNSPPAQPASPDSSRENPPQTPHPIPKIAAYPDTPVQCSIQNHQTRSLSLSPVPAHRKTAESAAHKKKPPYTEAHRATCIP